MPNPGSTMPPAQIGQTDFTTEEGAGNGSGNVGDNSRATAGGAPGAAPAPTVPGAAESAVDKAPPGGRLADVEEADIYKVDKNRLFYLNTYRGFMIYDVNDTRTRSGSPACRCPGTRSRCSSPGTRCTPCCAMPCT